MAFERDWDETTPTDQTEANQIDDFNRNLRKDLRERLAVDHVFTSSDTGQSVGEATLGNHSQVTLVEAADIGTGAEAKPILGGQTVGGKPELTYTDEDDNDVQMTAEGMPLPVKVSDLEPSPASATSTGGMWFDSNDDNRSIAIYDNDGTEDDFYPFSCPVGMISAYGGSSAPAGWLLCDGTTGLNTTTNPEYIKLFAIIGTTYGGAGATDFDLPDLRGRAAIGVGTGDAADATAHALADKEGAETHQLTEAQLASHNHLIEYQDVLSAAGSSGVARNGSGTNNGTIRDAGSNQAHNNLQPSLTLNYIIKF